ncbi:hypothetical protein PG996_010592 [Apiospora saccharicola]|uniref:Uncharacterized protein n=1 Tax=Apiospora saccharicola TaxID=335842 RepID=A0ABR1UP11_9PEZI
MYTCAVNLQTSKVCHLVRRILWRIFVIPGTRRVKYLEENWAANWVELTDDEEKELRQLAESSELAGEALPEQFLDHKFRDTKELSS